MNFILMMYQEVFLPDFTGPDMKNLNGESGKVWGCQKTNQTTNRGSTRGPLFSGRQDGLLKILIYNPIIHLLSDYTKK